MVRSSLDRDKTSHTWSEWVGFDQNRVRTGRNGHVQSEMGRGWSAVVELSLGWVVGDQFRYWLFRGFSDGVISLYVG